jgi:apolipoprotein N-acyltransferase
VAGILSLALLYGALRLQQWPRAAAANPTRVAVIQPNLDLGSAWMSELYGRNLRKYLELTYEAAKATRADLVVWPETAMTFYVAYEPAYRASLAQVLEPADIELIAGGVHYLGEAHDRRFYNSTFLIEPSGEVKGRYDKLRLLPFAEYFPSTLLDFARRDFGEVREFAPGNPTSPLVTRAGTAGVLVCNEAFFGQLAAERVETGATLLVNPSNDSWMGDPSYALQAFQISRLRAIEQRRYLVRTSTSGPSAIVDPGGRVLEATDPDTRGWIAGEVSPQSERTVYQRVGDAFGLACLAAVVLAILPLAWRSDR